MINTRGTSFPSTQNEIGARSSQTWAERVNKSAAPTVPAGATNYIKQYEELWLEKTAEIDRRTQVIRRAPQGMYEDEIIHSLHTQYKEEYPEGFLEGVVADGHDRRRYYITYTDYETKRAIARQGFQIGHLKIPGETADVCGFMPNVPYYLTDKDLRQLLKPYGTVLKGDFKRYMNTDIRSGGYHFELDLHPQKRLPKTMTIYGDTITIIDKNGLKQCTYCNRFGHLRRYCHDKLKDQEHRRTNWEKQQEVAENELEMESEDDENDDHDAVDDAGKTEVRLPEQEEEDERLKQAEKTAADAKDEAEEQERRAAEDTRNKSSKAEFRLGRTMEAGKTPDEVPPPKKTKIIAEEEPTVEELKEAQNLSGKVDNRLERMKQYQVHSQDPIKDKEDRISQTWTRNSKSPVMEIEIEEEEVEELQNEYFTNAEHEKEFGKDREDIHRYVEKMAKKYMKENMQAIFKFNEVIEVSQNLILRITMTNQFKEPMARNVQLTEFIYVIYGIVDLLCKPR